MCIYIYTYNKLIFFSDIFLGKSCRERGGDEAKNWPNYCSYPTYRRKTLQVYTCEKTLQLLHLCLQLRQLTAAVTPLSGVTAINKQKFVVAKNCCVTPVSGSSYATFKQQLRHFKATVTPLSNNSYATNAARFFLSRLAGRREKIRTDFYRRRRVVSTRPAD